MFHYFNRALQDRERAASLLNPSTLLLPHPSTTPPQLPTFPHTLPRHLINVTHQLPSKTEGIVFVSLADKGFWKADMHNDSVIIASLVWSPFLSVPHAACCCPTEQLSAAVSPENMFGSQIHLVSLWPVVCRLSLLWRAYLCVYRERVCERMSLPLASHVVAGKVVGRLSVNTVCPRMFRSEEGKGRGKEWSLVPFCFTIVIYFRLQ